MRKSLLSLALSLLAVAVHAASPDPLVGTWDLEGHPAYSMLRTDHTGRVGEEPVKWSASRGILTLTYPSRVDVMPYSFSGNTLTVVAGGETYVYTRNAKKTAKAGEKAPAAEKAGGDKLSTMLLSSAWCYFRYNKVSGSSHQERVVFRKDGTWASGARGESYSSGMYGTVSGQSDSGSGGRWSVKSGALLMSQGGGALADTELRVTHNSNGWPILNTGGKEYSSCK